MTDMDAKRDEIRSRLRCAAALRQQADEAKGEATLKLTSALKDAADHGISHSESSRLGGVTRNGAYELLRKAERGENAGG